MARFSPQFIQQVQQATDIVDLVSQYVALTKRGKEFVGLCPFHNDHKPSMYVVPAKQIFHCFVCQAGGGVFKFIEMFDKVTFPEAVEFLAERANIPIPQERPPAPGEISLGKGDLLKVTTFAAEFFRRQLLSPFGAAALEYARKRGIADESIERFGLGYAPDYWDGLLRAARKEGIHEQLLQAAGLVVNREGGNGCYDRFRNRLMFPIMDITGKVIAFGGRALAADERAKYLNSPETPLFDKSSNLYAMNWSREGISSSGQAVVVEGYLDAVIPLQAGVNNVVATLGTALTDRHIRILGRYAREVVLVFDADAAGQAASERALEMFLQQALHVRVAAVPAGKDPCDYTLAEGGEAMKKVIHDAPDALQYAWARRQALLAAAGDNLAERRRVVEDFLRLIVSSSAYGAIDEVRRGQLTQHIAHLLNLTAGELQQQMKRMAREIPRASAGGADQAGPARMAPRQATTSAESMSGLGLAQRHVLEVLLNCPDLFDHAAERLGPDDFIDDQMRTIAKVMWQAGLAGRHLMEDALATEEGSALSGVIAELATAGEKRGNYQNTLDGALEQIYESRRRQEMQDIKQNGLNDDALRKLSPHLRKADVRRFPGIR